MGWKRKQFPSLYGFLLTLISFFCRENKYFPLQNFSGFWFFYNLCVFLDGNDDDRWRNGCGLYTQDSGTGLITGRIGSDEKRNGVSTRIHDFILFIFFEKVDHDMSWFGVILLYPWSDFQITWYHHSYWWFFIFYFFGDFYFYKCGISISKANFFFEFHIFFITNSIIAIFIIKIYTNYI